MGHAYAELDLLKVGPPVLAVPKRRFDGILAILVLVLSIHR